VPLVRTLVSIHARTRRATSTRTVNGITRSFQSTPARGGRRVDRGDGFGLPAVSIHARTRRATGS